MELTKRGTPRQRQHKTRSKEERIAALVELAARQDAGESTLEASKAMDVPRSTIRDWATPELLEEVRQGTSGIAVRQLKSQMLADMTRMASIMLALTEKMAAKEDTKSAKDAAVASGIFIDKTLLLAGQATNRTERVSSDPNADMQKAARAILDAVKQPSGPVIDAEYSVKQAISDNVDSQRTVEDKPSP